MVHLDLVDALDGSWDAAALMNRIEYRAGDGWWAASRAAMCAELRFTEHRLKSALTLLRDRRMIECQRVSAFDPTLQYRPAFADEADTGSRDGVTHRHEPEPPADTVTAGAAVTTSLKEQEELLPPLPPAQLALVGDADVERGDPIDAEFAGFWELWPRKDGKQAAFKAYRAVRRSGVPQTVIADGLREHLPVLQARERQYVPHAATWLGQRRFTELAPPMPKQRMAGDPWANLDPNASYGGGIFGATAPTSTQPASFGGTP